MSSAAVVIGALKIHHLYSLPVRSHIRLMQECQGTLEPRYNTVRYNTNSDIRRMRVGPQFLLFHLPEHGINPYSAN